MRTVNIYGQDFKIRGLKRREIIDHLSDYGYTGLAHQPPTKEDGKPDFRKIDEGRNRILELVLSADEINRLEDIGGNAACQLAVSEIIKETYPDWGELKNSSNSGSGEVAQKDTEPATDAKPSVSESK